MVFKKLSPSQLKFLKIVELNTWFLVLIMILDIKKDFNTVKLFVSSIKVNSTNVTIFITSTELLTKPPLFFKSTNTDNEFL